MPAPESLRQTLQSGLQAYESGDLNAAVTLFRQAVTLAPDHPGARNLLGVALLGTGQAAAAIAELERAARLARNDAAILGNLAQAYAAAERHSDAHDSYRKASRIDPRSLQYAQGAAIALAQQKKFDAAQLLLERLTARFPEAAAPWYNLGNLQREQDRLTAAEQCYREALKREPGHLDACNNLGSVLHAQLQFTAAESAFHQCLAAQPDHFAAHLNLVSVLIDDGRFTEAEDACRKLLERAPDLPDAHRFLAVTLGHQGRSVDALPAYARAAALAPEDPAAQRSYAGALAETGHLLSALRALAHAAKHQDDDVLQQLQSAIFLAHGFFAQGWASYRRRPAFIAQAAQPGKVALTQTLPADLAGKHVVILGEQGIGDELFFLRYAPLLKERGARVTACISTKIAPLVTRSACADTVMTGEDASTISADLQLLCGDLPHVLSALATTLIDVQADTLPRRDFPLGNVVVYPPLPATLRIPALPDAMQRIRARLRTYGEPPYLGITWRAGVAARDQRGADWALSKDIPLQKLAQSLRGATTTLLALQRHPAPGELSTLAKLVGKPVHDCTDLNENLEDMLALLATIDDYVGVSNTNMHLRAAAGHTARVLVPNPPEWRWTATGSTSPWFPGFTVYRQSLNGDWSHALQRLTRDLHAGIG